MNRIKKILKYFFAIIKRFYKFICIKFRKQNSIATLHKKIKTYSSATFKNFKHLIKKNRNLKQYLKSTPWYIVIGSAKSGKDLFIINSKLNLSPNENYDFTTIQEKFNPNTECGWWFTKEAIFLSVAYNCNNESIREVATYNALLKLIKKYRLKKYFSGIIITLDLPDFLLLDSTKKNSHSETIKTYLNKAHQQFQNRIPVYLAFTKCDLISGFIDFFNYLSQPEREQIFGITAPLDLSADIESVKKFYSSEYDNLIEILNKKMFWRLANEHDQQRRYLISYFPEQIQLLKSTIISFICNTFANGDYPFDERIHFRGFYFTSAEQHGRPIDFLMATLGKQFNLDYRPGSDQLVNRQSFFLKKIFTQLIFPEKELVGNSHKSYLHKRLFLLASIPIGFIIFITIICSSYRINSTSVNQANDELRYFYSINKNPIPNNSIENKIVDLTKRLNTLGDVNSAYHNVDNPWLIYSGIINSFYVKIAVKNATLRILQHEFLPLITKYYEKIITTDQKNPNLLYADLKGYLALSLPKKIPSFWIYPPAYRAFQNDFKQPMSENLSNYLKITIHHPIPPQNVNYKLIAQARDTLKHISPGRRAYWLLKQQAEINSSNYFNFKTDLGAYFNQVFQKLDKLKPTNKIYTHYDFDRTYFKTALKVINTVAQNDQILGLNSKSESSESKNIILREFRTLYLQDYIGSWQKFFDQLEIAQFQNLNQAISVMQILISNQSPLPKLFKLINVNLAPTKKINNDKFTELMRIIEIGKNQSTSLADINKSLKKLYQFLEKINNADDRKTAAFNAAIDINNVKLFKVLNNQVNSLPQPLQKWYHQIMANCLNAVYQSALSLMESTSDYSYNDLINKKIAGFDFAITPEYLDPKSKDINLKYGAKTISYAHGPREQTFLKWPQENPNIQITLADFKGNYPTMSYKGPWALFKWLKNSTFKQTSPNRYKITTNIKGHKAVFAIESRANLTWLRK